MMDFIDRFFTVSSFIPHGHCYLWQPLLVGLHILSDTLIAIAYYSIPLTLVYFTSRRSDLPFNRIFLLFCIFIFACGTTHAIGVLTVWYPVYWLSGVMKAITAATSVLTAIQMILLLPQALAFPSPVQLEMTNQELEWQIIQCQQTEQALRESQECFRNAFEYGAIGMALVGLDGSWLKVNRSLCEIVGYSQEELLGLKFQDITHPEDLENDLNYAEQLLEEEIRCYHLEKRYLHKLGHEVWILLSGSVVRDANNLPLYFISEIQDITNRKQAELEIIRSRDLKEAIYHESTDAIFLVDSETLLTIDCNRRALELFELSSQDEIINVSAYSLQKRQFSSEELNTILLEIKNKGFWSQEIEYSTKRGNIFWGNVAAKPINVAGRTIVLLRVTDISERKQIEALIRASLKEKEVLLQEIHHRVKNNLQIICSLLKLQSDCIQDSQTRAVLQESQNRVRAMALIHEKLYQSKDLAHINFAAYIQNLALNLFRSYQLQSNYVNLRVDLRDVFLDVDLAVPCGLILNELISNALKYAFPQNRNGEVFIKLEERDRKICLMVSDTGIGLPQDFDVRTTHSLGWELIRNLTKQIKGSLNCQSQSGTKIEIIFSKSRS